MSLNIIFAGTPDFAVPSLKILVESSEHKIVAVYTQPDAPAGRGQKLLPSAVKQYALSQNIAIVQPTSLRDVAAQAQLKSFSADIMVVVAYGQILPEAVLRLFRFGCINVHASLLPRWRGAAPIQRAILAGDEVSGITIMQMAKGLDTGAILYQTSTPIDTSDTGGSLHDRLAISGSQALLTVLNNVETYIQEAKPQEETLATYAHKLRKQEGQLDWCQTAEILARQIRAFTPWPGSFCYVGETRLHVHEASVVTMQVSQPVGTILTVSKIGIDVATAKNVLRITRLQFPGGKPLLISDMLNAKPNFFTVGMCLDPISKD